MTDLLALPGWFNPWGWTAIAAVVIIVLVAIIVLIILSGRKSDRNAGGATTAGDATTASGATAAEEDGATAAEADEEPEDEAVKEKKTSDNKVYHISKRKDDGKWQVKAAGGAKALKLFDTQAEAIDYAKTVADNQDAKIMIHKEDGSFRRLSYK